MGIKAKIKKFLYHRELNNAVKASEQHDSKGYLICLHSVCKKDLVDRRSNVLDTLFYVRISIVNNCSDHNLFTVRASTEAFRKHDSMTWLATRELVDGRFEHLFSYILKEDLPDSIITYSSKVYSFSVYISHEELVDKHFEYDLAHCHCVRDTVYDLWHKERMKVRISELKAMPPCSRDVKFSFIIPFFKTDPVMFDELLSDIRDQTYSNWELIAINASPEDEVLCGRIEHATSIDGRVKAVTLERNLGITLNSVEGAKIATGDYLCYCDHDDRLESTILEEYARAIEQDPGIGLLYCDEDLLYTNTDGHLGSPAIKPDYSPVMLTCTNYICHMLCVKKDIYDMIEPTSNEYDGAQDYKLTLDAILNGAKVHHVSEPLYHWRCSDTSTAGHIDQKTYAVDAGRRATDGFLDFVGIEHKGYEIDYMPCYYFNNFAKEMNATLLVVIPVLEIGTDISNCLKSLFASDLEGMRVVVSIAEDVILEEDLNYPYVEVIKFKNETKSEMVNEVIKTNSSDYICIMNPNVEIDDPSLLQELISICDINDIHGVNVRLLDETGFSVNTKSTFGRGGVCIADTGLPFHCESPEDAYMLNDDFMVISREDFELVGGYDESFPHTFADADFSLRLREIIESSGHDCVFCYQGNKTAKIHKFPQIDGITRENYTYWKEMLPVSNVKSDLRLVDALDKFAERHASRIEAGDPFYSDRLDKFKMNHRFDIEFLLK